MSKIIKTGSFKEVPTIDNTLDSSKVYCINCVRYYSDQCNIPNCGVSKEAFYRYKNRNNIRSESKLNNIMLNVPKSQYTDTTIRGKIDSIGSQIILDRVKRYNTPCTSKSMIISHPDDLNMEGDCYFYKPFPRWAKFEFLKEIVRAFY